MPGLARLLYRPGTRPPTAAYNISDLTGDEGHGIISFAMITSRHLVILMLMVAILASCTSSARRDANLQNTSHFITFDIKLDGQPGGEHDTSISLKITNITDEKVGILVPVCLFGHCHPFCIDSTGRDLPIQFHIHPRCPANIKMLAPGESHENYISFTLEDCFDLSHAGIYRIWFVYYANIYNIYNEVISNGKAIKSNVIEFTITE
jgi:hypothetical protein